MKVLITGSTGFIGNYLTKELLYQGHSVVGIDNFSRYGKVKNSFAGNPRYRFIEGDAKDTLLLKETLKDCDHFVGLAAVVGGLGFFHTATYDTFTENERITLTMFDAALSAFTKHRLKKITVISTTMVFESTNIFPTPESVLTQTPPPKTTYGFQKLSCEYMAKAAWQQYKLPYTIIRPGNVVGIGEVKRLSDKTVQNSVAVNHVVPDLALRILKGEYPLHILGDGKQIRHFIYGADIAKAIVMSLFSPAAKNEDFNIASDTSTTILGLAAKIWDRIYPDKPFKYTLEKPLRDDTSRSEPDVTKAQTLLGFRAQISIDEMLDIVIPWVRKFADKI